MRVLVLTQVTPNPPDAGPKIKTHYLLRKLAEEHEVELLTYVRDDRELAAAEALAPWCERIITIPLRRQRWREPLYALRGWGTGRPYLIARDERRAMDRAIRERLASGEVDVLHADQVSMATYLRHAKSYGVSTVFDAHNAIWELLRTLRSSEPSALCRAALSLEWRLMRRFEGRAVGTADLTLCVTAEDQQLLEDAAGGPINATVAPIGIEARDCECAIPAAGKPRVLSVATMHYPPNAEAVRWFRDQIWPVLAMHKPDLQVDIVGSRPPADIVRWGIDAQRVSVHGYVEHLDPYYSDTCIFIVPLLAGSGMRVKIIEAMARGVPVISTTVGAAGLDLEPGKHLLIADRAEDFAIAVASLADSVELRREITDAARALVRQRYDWRVAAEPVMLAYRGLASRAVTESRAVPTKIEQTT